MTTINDQPQHILARYADRTGCTHFLKRQGTFPLSVLLMSAEEAVKAGSKIRIELSEYGLPSHLKPYKDNPRLPGEGYRVPTGEDSCNQQHDRWHPGRNEWVDSVEADCCFSRVAIADYRLPASVPFPDWNEMTREDAPAGAESLESQTQGVDSEQYNVVLTPPHPEIFEAHGLEWYRHDESDKCPCDHAARIHWLITQEMPPRTFYNKAELLAKELDWTLVAAWRPADAPAKLPRPGPQPQDDVQALKARVQELEGDYQMMQGSLLSILGELDCEEPASALLRIKTLKEEKNASFESTKKYASEVQEIAELLGHPLSPFYRVKQRLEEVLKEAASSAPTLRPIAEMPAEVPEGFKRVFWTLNSGWWSTYLDFVTHFLDIRLPAPPDPDAEMRREFEAWMKGYNLQPDELAFQAFKAGKSAR